MQHSSRHDTCRRWATRLAFGGFLAGLLVMLPGCPSDAPKTSVKGKVLLGDKGVTGQIVFIGADGKKFEGAAGPDGSYIVGNLTPGKYKITVSSPLGIAETPAAPPKDGPKDKDVGSIKSPPTASMGVPPPKKYADADKGGLTYDFEGGHKVHDITLTQ